MNKEDTEGPNVEEVRDKVIDKLKPKLIGFVSEIKDIATITELQITAQRAVVKFRVPIDTDTEGSAKANRRQSVESIVSIHFSPKDLELEE